MQARRRRDVRQLTAMGLFIFLGLSVGLGMLPYVYAQNEVSARQESPRVEAASFVGRDLAALIGILAAVAGCAVGYGLAMGKVSATLSDHIANVPIHRDVQALTDVFMPRKEIALLVETIFQRVANQYANMPRMERPPDGS